MVVDEGDPPSPPGAINLVTSRRRDVRLAVPSLAGWLLPETSPPRVNRDMIHSEQRKWLALALLSVVQFMVVLDLASVNVALPSMQADLGFSPENLQWVVSAYALFFGGFLLLGGRSADLLGRVYSPEACQPLLPPPGSPLRCA